MYALQIANDAFSIMLLLDFLNLQGSKNRYTQINPSR